MTIYIHDVTIRSGVSIENTTICSLRSNSGYNIIASFVAYNSNLYPIIFGDLDGKAVRSFEKIDRR